MKIKSLLIIPGREVQIIKIPSNIKFIKSLIGDKLRIIKLNKDTIIISNKNAQVEDFNRMLGEKIIIGTFLIVGNKKEHRVSLRRKQIQKYSNYFKLEKHEKKINYYKEKYLIEYYKELSKTKTEKFNFSNKTASKAA